jgi:predicted LPLAT superfamily acyltransferase
VGSVSTLTIGPEHPALAGHFPGTPIVPGVVLLDETLRAVEQDAAAAARGWRISTAKFLSPVRPGEALTLEHEPLADGSLRFTVSRDGRLVAHGVLIPERLKSADGAAGARASASQWVGEPERGNAAAARILTFLALRLGRRFALLMLWLNAAYFYLFAPTARRHSRQYLRRALARAPTRADFFRHVYAFGATLLDRLYLVHGRMELFAVTIEGEELLHAAAARNGTLLVGAHLGNFGIMSTIGRRRPGVRVAMAMYEHNASRIAAIFRDVDPASAPEIIPLGRLDAMLRIRDVLDAGGFVGMLADRTIGEAPAQVVSFLGAPALFPSGPMRAAAALRRRVLFMSGLYRGGNHYHIVFHELADFSQPAPAGREAAVREAIARYVTLLEKYCRSDPYNWFNFYDFWHGAPA